MPIYEYQCQSCQHELEALQKISDAPLRDCPECGKPALKKKVSAAAFRLKGGGWYETDFKTGGKKNLAGDGSDSKSDKATDKATGKTADTSGTSGTSSKSDSAAAGKNASNTNAAG